MEISATGLRRRARQVLRCVERGETVTITYRGHPRARVVAIDNESVRQEELSPPAFGIWKDRAEMADVYAHVRRLRGSRTNFPGLGLESQQPTEAD